MRLSSVVSTHKKSLILAAALGATAVALVAAVVYGDTQISRRDAQIASLTVANSDLQNAKSALQDDLNRLTQERQQLLQTRETLQSQLADAKALNDQLTADRDRLEADEKRLQSENEALTRKVSAIPPTPTPSGATVGANSAALTKVLALDDQIEQKFDSFYGELQQVLDSFNRGDLMGAQAEYQKANQTGAEIKQLLQSRDAAAQSLR